MPPAQTQTERELAECREELDRLTTAAAELRTAFFAACPESERDGRFFEMMGDPVCVLRHVTTWLRTKEISR